MFSLGSSGPSRCCQWAWFLPRTSQDQNCSGLLPNSHAAGTKSFSAFKASMLVVATICRLTLHKHRQAARGRYQAPAAITACLPSADDASPWMHSIGAVCSSHPAGRCCYQLPRSCTTRSSNRLAWRLGCCKLPLLSLLHVVVLPVTMHAHARLPRLHRRWMP